MNTKLAPTHQKLFDLHWVLWFMESNTYSIVDYPFKTCLDSYLLSDSLEDFGRILKSDNQNLDADNIAKTIYTYLKNCNIPYISEAENNLNQDFTKRHILKQYVIKDKTIQIYFDSELVLKSIHPALAHLESNNIRAQSTFDVYLKNEHLHLFKDSKLIKKVPQTQHHLIQGKFLMLLLCSLYENDESDWIGTLHGSTITNEESSLLFAGKSGKGKSTLCAILASHGYKLLADDVSPLLSETLNIYYNPAAVSIKKGAFPTFNAMIDNFDTLPSIEYNKTKGALKYVPLPSPEKSHYPCKAIVLVNYLENTKTILEKATIEAVLETLIPDSWLSPKSQHAKQFLDWLETLDLYELTYSDTNDMLEQVSQLFE
ncbi:hypothetical protein [Winogradskyella sp. A2]|uniref:hypothetical protein n=1 Tax=Winogradskyella sp. A2 TaxID=3366944 RepID=UPI00398C76BF